MSRHQRDFAQKGRRPPYPKAYRKAINRAQVKARTKIERRDIVSPGVRLKTEGGDTTWGPVFKGNDDYWQLAIFDALGTRSDSVARYFIDQLIELSDGQHPDQTMVNASLAIIGSYKPRNEGEAMLAAQMVAVHVLTMKAGAYVNMHGRWSVPKREAKLVFRGARTFAEQTETMARLKGRKGRQDIHVHYHDQRQILDGDVHVHRGSGDFGAPSRDANAGCGKPSDACPPPQHPVRATLRGQDAQRLALPSPEGEGPAALPFARLRAWIGRATGGSQRSLQAWSLDDGGEGEPAPAFEGMRAFRRTKRDLVDA